VVAVGIGVGVGIEIKIKIKIKIGIRVRVRIRVRIRIRVYDGSATEKTFAIESTSWCIHQILNSRCAIKCINRTKSIRDAIHWSHKFNKFQ
jgi:hypothetical protein